MCTDMEKPLVSAIMPTRGRPAFARRAIDCFLAQTWPAKELCILDDGDAPSFAAPPPRNLPIRYERMMRRLSVGAKRNVLCSRAAGDIICHWDDDDWSAPDRIEDQVLRLASSPSGLTGYHSMAFYTETGEKFYYRNRPGYALGTSLMYTRDFWRAHCWPDLNVGEDNAVVMHATGVVSVDAGERMWARIHPGNTSPKRGLNSAQWSRVA